MAGSNRYDLTVIGSGPGGYVAAIRGAQLGLATAVVEKESAPGGTCLHWGCIPAKALLRTAEVLDTTRGASAFGVRVDEPSLDLPSMHRYKDKTIRANVKGVEYLFKKNGVTLIHGHGRLGGEGEVEVTPPKGDPFRLESKATILASGSVIRGLPGVEFDGERILHSDHALTLDRVPESMIVLGAGAVGVEFASVYRSFGSRVVLVELLPHLVPLEDEDLGTELARVFKKRGIETHTGTRVEQVDTTDAGVRLTAVANGKTLTLEAEVLLVAVGRRPLSEDLGLAGSGVEVDDRGFISVDETMRTGCPGVYAIGDLLATQALAHVASHEGIVAAEHAAGHQPHPIDYDKVPSCTYCHPEVASIGLSEKVARERGHDVAIGRFPFTAIGKAKILNDTTGFVKIVTDRRYDEVLGVHIIGPHATELISEATAAVNLEATAESLFHAIHAHPTLSEAMGDAALSVHERAMRVDVTMPQMGESIAEGTISRWIKKVGDAVERDEPILEISTDKVDAEIPSPAAGVLAEINSSEGETVPVNHVIAVIETEGAGGEVAAGAPAAATEPAQEPQAPPAKETAPVPPSAGKQPAERSAGSKVTPVVRKIAAEHGIDPTTIPGSGVGGRVTKKDILAFLESGAAAPTPSAAAAAPPRAPAPATRPDFGSQRTVRETMTVMRKKIAEHMIESRRTSAHVHSVFEVDMTRVMKLRAQHKAAYLDRHGTKLTVTPFFIKAVCDALQVWPVVNASVEGDEIVYKKDLNVGVAVALDWGLIVPVVRNADRLSIAGLSVALQDLAERARSKKLNPDDVQGGTFTITNPGQFGGQFGLPIINQPQVAILGIGGIEKRPVVIDDAIAIRSMMYMAMSYDHRVVDGAVADQFLALVKRGLQEFDESLL